MSKQLKFEDQVCSLEYAKRLKELGVEQNALYNWAALDIAHPLHKVHVNVSSKERVLELINGVLIRGDDPYKEICGEFIHYSAFTIAELIPLFPGTVSASLGRKEAYPHSKMYSVYYIYGDGKSFSDDNGANALAALLIHLIENNLIKPSC